MMAWFFVWVERGENSINAWPRLSFLFEDCESIDDNA